MKQPLVLYHENMHGHKIDWYFFVTQKRYSDSIWLRSKLFSPIFCFANNRRVDFGFSFI